MNDWKVNKKNENDILAENINSLVNSSEGVKWIEWDATVNSSTKKLIYHIVKKEVERRFARTVGELRNNLFTLFAILASVIAFLFAEIQILKSLCSRESIAWFTLILLWSLSLFLLLIKIFLSSKDKIKFDCPLIILWIFIMIILAVWVYLSSQWDEIKCRDDAIFEKYEEIFNEKQEEFSNKIEKNLKMNQEIFMSSYFQSSGLWKTVVQSTNLSGNCESWRWDSAK